MLGSQYYVHVLYGLLPVLLLLITLYFLMFFFIVYAFLWCKFLFKFFFSCLLKFENLTEISTENTSCFGVVGNLTRNNVIKSKTSQRGNEPCCMPNDYLAGLGRVSSVDMYAVIAAMTGLMQKSALCCILPCGMLGKYIVGGGLLSVKPTVRGEGFLDGIQCNVFMTKMNLHAGRYWLGFDLEKDELRQVYLPKERYAWMKTSPTFNPDIWKELV